MCIRDSFWDVQTGRVSVDGADVREIPMKHLRDMESYVTQETHLLSLIHISYHITSPLEDGSGAARAMELAMEEAGVKPEEVTYINAHGTSTHHNLSLIHI